MEQWDGWLEGLPVRQRKFINNFWSTAQQHHETDFLSWVSDCGQYGFNDLVHYYAETMVAYKNLGPISEEPSAKQIGFDIEIPPSVKPKLTW